MFALPNKFLYVYRSDKRLFFSLAILGVIFLLAVFAPWVVQRQPGDFDITRRLCSPSADEWFGCDLYGGSVWTALWYGARVSFYVSFAAVAFSLLIGTVLGLLAGYFGGWFDAILMRCTDLVMAFPGILLALALAAVLGPSVNNIILTLAITGWTAPLRLVRSQALSLKSREYVLACRLAGGSHSRVLFIHMLPNILPSLFVQGTFSLSGVILMEASLSFLGLGSQEASPTWGALLNQARSTLSDAPHLAVFPGLLLFIVILCLNHAGDALRDLFDPKSK